MSESFVSALRVELDAVVGRYEALVRALAEAGGRETEALRAEVARLSSENERLRAGVPRLEARVEELERELLGARTQAEEAEKQAQAALSATQEYEEQFAAEKRFVQACGDLSGSLLGEALVAVVGRALTASSATYAALKARGLEATVAAALRERGRSSGQAPLLPRERTALAALAAAAGCELITPADGTRFSASAMERGGSVSDPAEEGNVVSVAMPGLRRAGTEGTLVFPRVVVATG